MDYLTWTYWFRRVLKNPTYYGIDSTEPDEISALLSDTVEDSLADLEAAGCVEVDEHGGVRALAAGRVASFYYLQHTTMGVFADRMGPDMGVPDCIDVLTSVPEYDELPVRHNEDQLNMTLNDDVR